MNKNIIIRFAVAAVFVAAAGYGVYQTQAEDMAMSEIALANVEALAEDEVPVNLPCEKSLYSVCNFIVTYEEDGKTVVKPGKVDDMKYKG